MKCYYKAREWQIKTQFYFLLTKSWHFSSKTALAKRNCSFSKGQTPIIIRELEYKASSENVTYYHNSPIYYHKKALLDS